jgi:hypothetical protein
MLYYIFVILHQKKKRNIYFWYDNYYSEYFCLFVDLFVSSLLKN